MATREEIIAGLQNAITKGDSIEHAVQTFISAGYLPEEVQEAASQVNMGVIGKMPQQIPQQIPQQNQEPKTQPLPNMSLPQFQEGQKPKRKIKAGVIVLIVILVILLGGIVTLAIFGESLLSAMFGK